MSSPALPRALVRTGRVVPVLAALAILGLLTLPVVALVASTRWTDVVAGLSDPLAFATLRLSLATTTVSLALAVGLGTPLAWWLARHPGPLERAVSTVVQLPVVIPPAVSGLALLLAFGRHGTFGPLLGRLHVSLPFTPAAVVLAEVFVASPFFIQSAVAGFRRVDGNLLRVAATLGASPARRFFRVAVPLGASGLWTGTALCWARALGEFGATLMFAGNLSGRTQTLPLAIYTSLESDLRPAKALSLLLVIVAFGVLLALRKFHA